MSEQAPYKIAILGLDGVGKTTLVLVLNEERDIDILENQSPTKGIAFREIESHEERFIVWDFGGQEIYRSGYLEAVERNFARIHLLIYVFDIQDFGRHDLALEYLDAILQAYAKFSEGNAVLILLHKADPGILNIPSVKAKTLDLVKRIIAIKKKSGVPMTFRATTVFDAKVGVGKYSDDGYFMPTPANLDCLKRFIRKSKLLHQALENVKAMTSAPALIAPAENIAVEPMPLEKSASLGEFRDLIENPS